MTKHLQRLFSTKNKQEDGSVRIRVISKGSREVFVPVTIEVPQWREYLNF